MSYFNFMHCCFGTEVSSSKPCVDGYEASNLICKPHLGNTGFLAETYIRPPVEITIKFPFSVKIKEILLDTKVGNQFSSVVEVWANYENDNKHASSSLSEKVGSINAVNTQGNHTFTMTNNTFKYNNKFDGLASMNSLFPSASISTESNSVLYLHKRRSVISVVLKITKVSSGSACALNRVEIWGQPDVSVPLDVLKEKITHKKHYSSTQEDNTLQNRLKCLPNDDSKIMESTVPEEFLDKLTLNLITCPMLLPSGNNVDISTVEKYNAEEAVWGRPPADPFTGIPFTQTSFPVVNMSLKIRIDNFLLSGRKITCDTLQLREEQIDIDMKKSYFTSVSAKHKIPDEEELWPAPKKKFKKSVSSSCDRDKNALRNDRDFGDNHNHRLDSSLSEAVNKNLFYSFNSKSSDQSKYCINCNCLLKEVIYKLKCGHYACGKCISNNSEKDLFCCAVDQQRSEKSDIRRVHMYYSAR